MNHANSLSCLHQTGVLECLLFFSSNTSCSVSPPFWPVTYPGLNHLQTSVNYPGSGVKRAFVGCFPLINKNKCIALSCFLQGHCFPGQEEALGQVLRLLSFACWEVRSHPGNRRKEHHTSSGWSAALQTSVPCSLPAVSCHQQSVQSLKGKELYNLVR